MGARRQYRAASDASETVRQGFGKRRGIRLVGAHDSDAQTRGGIRVAVGCDGHEVSNEDGFPLSHKTLWMWFELRYSFAVHRVVYWCR
jgi:hypothetical protein